MNLNEKQFAPLAARQRPKKLADYVGQRHLLAPGKPLHSAITLGKLHSMILWGPAGVGKTTLAELLAEASKAEIETISAVLVGVKEIREVVARAEQRQREGKATILFVDEVHRFNKAQQDAFLPPVEKGTIIFIGATTENPSFHLNNALLSRTRVYVLKPLATDELLTVLDQALQAEKKILSDELRHRLVAFADGDARQCLNLLEVAIDFAEGEEINAANLNEVLSTSLRRFDKQGEAFYDQISALHKSVRGSDPDASLYWLARMLEAGCDPFYVARRVVRMASEDIGNADPRALTLALNAWETYERLGDQEGLLALAQAVVYCAVAPKSNAIYTAFNQAWQDAKNFGSLAVPLYLRNAPTALMKSLDYGKGYRYAHDEPGAFAAGAHYFPEKLIGKRYYEPVERGLEIKIKAKLDELRKKNSNIVLGEKIQC